MKKNRILVTGGLGFIGSYFVQLLLDRGYYVINIDKKTYAHRKDLKFDENPNYEFIHQDICNLKSLPDNIEYIVNFAAESHVDNSIKDNESFFNSNVKGVYNILELLRNQNPNKKSTFIQISTDEVYGDTHEHSFYEYDRLRPSSPYSASKAAADQLVLGWVRTYGIRARICRSCNNYGYGQHSEKLIPATIKLTLKNMKMTVHGDGSYRREWIHAQDNCEAILAVMEKGNNGEIYNISTNEEYSNLEIVKMILKIMDRPENHFMFVENRSGQDVRYSINSEKIKLLGWSPKIQLKSYMPEYIKKYEEKMRLTPTPKKNKLLEKLKRIGEKIISEKKL